MSHPAYQLVVVAQRWETGLQTAVSWVWTLAYVVDACRTCSNDWLQRGDLKQLIWFPSSIFVYKVVWTMYKLIYVPKRYRSSLTSTISDHMFFYTCTIYCWSAPFAMVMPLILLCQKIPCVHLGWPIYASLTRYSRYNYLLPPHLTCSPDIKIPHYRLTYIIANKYILLSTQDPISANLVVLLTLTPLWPRQLM
jgi:hypothetical protein